YTIQKAGDKIRAWLPEPRTFPQDLWMKYQSNQRYAIKVIIHFGYNPNRFQEDADRDERFLSLTELEQRMILLLGRNSNFIKELKQQLNACQMQFTHYPKYSKNSLEQLYNGATTLAI